MALQQVHGLHGSLVGAVTTAGVHGLLVPLHADNGDEVLHPHHVGSELLVNEGAVGEAHEDGVGVDFAELDEVLLPHQGFAAGIDIEVSAHFLALTDDAVNLVVGEVQLIAILCGPAALAVQVAGRGGIQQDGPGHVAIVFLTDFVALLPTSDAGVEEEVGQQGFGEAEVHFGHHTNHQLMGGGVLVGDSIADGFTLTGEGLGTVAREFVHHVHHVDQVFDGILFNVGKGLTQCKFFDAVA